MHMLQDGRHTTCLSFSKKSSGLHILTLLIPRHLTAHTVNVVEQIREIQSEKNDTTVK